jgi:hypothetical protein
MQPGNSGGAQVDASAALAATRSLPERRLERSRSNAATEPQTEAGAQCRCPQHRINKLNWKKCDSVFGNGVRFFLRWTHGKRSTPD